MKLRVMNLSEILLFSRSWCSFHKLFKSTGQYVSLSSIFDYEDQSRVAACICKAMHSQSETLVKSSYNPVISPRGFQWTLDNPSFLSHEEVTVSSWGNLVVKYSSR